MKAKLILACAAAGVAVSAFGATSATAEEPIGTISFLPGIALPGETVQISGRCDDPQFTTAPVVSSILNAPDLYGRDVGHGRKELISNATVKKDVKPGKYRVSYKCGTLQVNGDLWITDRPSVVVSPTKARPGQQVSVRVDCPKPGPVTSTALAVGELRNSDSPPPHQYRFRGVAKVKNVKPGAYRVSTTCAGKAYATTFTVLGASNAQVPVKPKGAPETGGE